MAKLKVIKNCSAIEGPLFADETLEVPLETFPFLFFCLEDGVRWTTIVSSEVLLRPKSEDRVMLLELVPGTGGFRNVSSILEEAFFINQVG